MCVWSCVFDHLHDIISIQEAVINICFHVFVSMFLLAIQRMEALNYENIH